VSRRNSLKFRPRQRRSTKIVRTCSHILATSGANVFLMLAYTPGAKFNYTLLLNTYAVAARCLGLHMATVWEQMPLLSFNMPPTGSRLISLFPGGAMVRVLARDTKGRGFDSGPFHFQVTTLASRSHTGLCLCHQAV